MGRSARWATAAVLVALSALRLTGAAHATGGDTVAAGDRYAVSAGGFAPDSPGLANLRSDPVHVGSFTADHTGLAQVDVTIPADTPLGPHELELAGIAPDGSARSVMIPITVVAPTPPPTTVLSDAVPPITAAASPAAPLPDTMPNTGSGTGFLASLALALLALGVAYLDLGRTLTPRPVPVVASTGRIRLRRRAPAAPEKIRLRRR
jgi:hypothetical protein